MTSIDESAMKGLESKGSDAENQHHCSVVRVEGYDTWLQPYYVKLMLEKHFSPCGKITDVLLSKDLETGLLESSASIFFDGEGAEDKALELGGVYFGGWKLVVAHENYSDYYDDDDDDEEVDVDAPVERVKKEEDEERRMLVLGFDVCAPELDIKIKLCEHFSSCGEVTNVRVVGQGQSDV